MNTSTIRYKEIKGLCINSGVMEITHNFTNEKELIHYLRENWFNLENADRITDILINQDTEGPFSLSLDSEH